MNPVLLRNAVRLNKKRKLRKGWQRVVQTLAAAVVFCTTYVLILPAITMQEAPVCGYEAHVHMDACYSRPQAELTGCGLAAQATVVHLHGDLCRNTDGGLICALEEKTVHAHNDSCYTQQTVLACIAPHEHSEDCVQTETAKICTLEESEGHTHGENCTGVQSVQICTMDAHEHGETCYEAQPCTCEIPESEEHIHSESCTGTQAVQTCTAQVHIHGEGCFGEQTVACEIPESEGHTHMEGCYAVTEIPCTEPTAEDHDHGDACWQQTGNLTCGKQELQLYSHSESCYDAEGNLICTLPVVVEHVHGEACLVVPEGAEPQLTCTLQVHTHTEECYPLEEEETFAIDYHCGYADHTHIDRCYHADGTLSCTIPEHAHEAACVVEDLDLTADMEWPAIWEAEIAELEFTGIWAEDLLTVAESQLGYAESKRNCILKNDQLLGYTRYADWCGKYYGEWDDMFVSFCLHYAGIPEETVPHESDTAKWIEALAEKELYSAAVGYTPVPGDLIFWDSDGDDVADKSGIVSEITPEQAIKVIAGDMDKKRVEWLTFAPEDAEKIAGYCPLPLSPMGQEQWKAAEAVNVLLAQLPQADVFQENLKQLNEAGDKAGYEALRQEAVSRIEAVEAAYNALNDTQKARIAGLEQLEALKKVCGGDSWMQFAALDDDGAVLTGLTADAPEVLPAFSEKAMAEEIEGKMEQEAPAVPENMVSIGDTIRYPFTAAAASYYTDVSYGEARVKVEFVLPLSWKKASFDLAAMPWLEEALVTTQTRLINETETECQVLSGYKRLTADETTGIVVPGSFTESVFVKVGNMSHGEQLVLIISAAMEHNAWEEICRIHQTAEKLTVISDIYTAYVPQDAQTQQANFEEFQLEAEEIKEQELSDLDQYLAAQELMLRIAECYNSGGLSDVYFDELSGLIAELSDINMQTIAEPCIGTNWMKIDFSESVNYGAQSLLLTSEAQTDSVIATAAMSAAVYSETFPSSQQIREEGGSNASADGAVMVSKTIAGTDVENVFDITLQIVTKDEVNEVYKDPDMAVVVVMDISNTMRTNFGNVTRYQAAMTAGTNFLEKFAEQNSTLSRVGYVAFNTDAHEIFGLTSCSNSTQAKNLATTMKNVSGTIVNQYVDKNGNTTAYYDSKRFTNMQAGLQMAADMLEKANNQHKYIIFISDGFPTTYLKSGYTGWDPNCSSGTNGKDGVFYDGVRSVYCNYGTSYSDTAAIKARTLATSLKAEGVNIFSIGVDVGGQNLWEYHNHAGGMAQGFSVVERRQNERHYNTNGYEIGTLHSVIKKTSVTDAEKTAMAQDFKDWLKGSATSGIGSGYYYDSTNLTGLNAAYDSIFQKILELNASSSHLDWVAADPMSDMGVHEVAAMEFIGFWDPDTNGDFVLVQDDLTGVSADGNLYDNTADFHEDTQTIHWDIKKSGYASQSAGSTTTYTCELKYRVRLKNEESVFMERESYDTNDVTTLTYRIIEVVGSQTSISERRTIEFPIPAVEGYLAELNFQKLQPTGNPLEGAEFTLSHDTASCGFCRGDNQGQVPLPDQVAASDRYGMVSFTRIPSGHIYTLTETVVPDGFIATKNAYQVTVSYDALTVTVTDADGKELEWNETIENDMYYALPETGGMGTSRFTFGGLLMIAFSLVYICIIGHKRQKGGR